MQGYIATGFPNLGYIQSEFSDEDLAPVKQEIFEIEDIKRAFRNPTERIVKQEYKLEKSKSHVQKLLAPYVSAYFNTFNFDEDNDFLTENRPLVIDKLKFNFLDKHEAQIPHAHGGIFTFLICIDIGLSCPPSPLTGDVSQPSKFYLHYINAIGRPKMFMIPFDKEWTNNFILFPSDMQHSVEPCFAMHYYRTSVAGTFKFEV